MAFTLRSACQGHSNLSLLGAIMTVLGMILFLLTSEGPSYAVNPPIWSASQGSQLLIPLNAPMPYTLAKADLDAQTEASRPISPDPPLSLSAPLNTGPAATAYIFKAQTPDDAARARQCLTSAIYYEAASESADGQRAVAQVILNRVRHPAWPNSICGVVYEGAEKPGCQFTFACDGSLARAPMAAAWQQASAIARAALAGYVFAPVGLATYYHTLSVNPAWNRPLTITAVIGRHIFYKLPGSRSTPAAFSDVYAAREPLPGPRRLIQAPLMTALSDDGAGQGASPAVVSLFAPQDDPRYIKGALPRSEVLPQYRQSGAWLRD